MFLDDLGLGAEQKHPSQERPETVTLVSPIMEKKEINDQK